jgi:uncharacterized membrane protein
MAQETEPFCTILLQAAVCALERERGLVSLLSVLLLLLGRLLLLLLLLLLWRMVVVLLLRFCR